MKKWHMETIDVSVLSSSELRGSYRESLYAMLRDIGATVTITLNGLSEADVVVHCDSELDVEFDRHLFRFLSTLGLFDRAMGFARLRAETCGERESEAEE